MRKVSSKICPLCKHTESIHVGDKGIIDGLGTFASIHVCKSCKHTFTRPTPDQSNLNELYRSQSQAVVGHGWLENYVLEENNPVRERILQEVISLKPRSILEIGCGNGALLKQLRDYGFDAIGIEPGGWMTAKYIYSELAQISLAEAFQCFVFQDVLEHVENPIAFLREFALRGSEPYSIILTVPAGDSPEARIEGVDWEMVRPFGHLHYFSRMSLEILASEANLKVRSIQRFRREKRVKSVMRVLLMPILWWRAKYLLRDFTNPYTSKNLKKFLGVALSRGDQYYAVFTKD